MWGVPFFKLTFIMFRCEGPSGQQKGDWYLGVLSYFAYNGREDENTSAKTMMKS